MASSEPSNVLAITAPENMPEGYVFHAEAEGRTFPVSVPAGGVTQGQVFHAVTIRSEPLEAPKGRWRHGFCDCWSTSVARCFMATHCQLCCFLGQVLQQYRLNTCGCPDGNSDSNTCLTWMVGLTLVYFAVVIVSMAVPPVSIVLYGVYLWGVVAATCLRFRVRRKYQIPGSCCGDTCCDDFCCMCWCLTLNLLQISRNSHHEGAYPYHAFSKTGLPQHAQCEPASEEHGSTTQQPMLETTYNGMENNAADDKGGADLI